MPRSPSRLLVLLASTLAGCLLACGHSEPAVAPNRPVATPSPVPAPREVRYGELLIVTDPWPPYSIPGRPISGFHAEIAYEAFRRLGQPVRIESFPWQRCLSMARRRQADAVLSLNRIPEREEFLDYPDEPLSISHTVFFVARNRRPPLRYDSPEDLVGKTIGLTIGYDLAGGLLDDPRLTFERAPQDVVNLRKLAAGRIDLWPSDLLVGQYLVRQERLSREVTGLPRKINQSPVYLGFSRQAGSAELAARFSATLAEMRREGLVELLEARSIDP